MNHLNVLEERQALAPFDDLVEPVIGDAAQTGQVVAIRSAVGGRKVCGRAAPVLLPLLLSFPSMSSLIECCRIIWQTTNAHFFLK